MENTTQGIARQNTMPRIAVLVSTPLRSGLAQAIATGEAPRRDYFELRDMLGAELMAPPVRPGRFHAALQKVGGNALAMAATAWLQRGRYDAILTDQESIGLALAMLFKLTGTRRGHVMISHYLTPAKKQVFFRLFKAQAAIDCTVCYSTAQEELALNGLGLRPDQVSLVLHPADSLFWSPAASSAESERDARELAHAGLDLPAEAPLVVSAGLEFRDYPTLMKAAGSLVNGAHVAIAASSPWSKRKNTAEDEPLPPNVHLLSLKPPQLRALYRRAAVVAVPLYDVDFQAGSLVAYEAMACGRPVAITRTRAQGRSDIVQEGVTGFYVPPAGADEMASTLNRLLADPALSARMGRAARQTVEEELNLDTYLNKMAALVREVAGHYAPDRRRARRAA
jgi:glycosyltransferase involved in cell wall biosynthesis